MSNFDIFNLSMDDFKSEDKKVETSTIYKSDPKLSKDSVYRSILRFIPNVENPKKSVVKKYSYWLESAEGNGFYVDCPSSINEKSIIQDTFWKLFKSDSAFEKKQAEKLKRKEYYYSYVLVVKDPQRPELENTVQLFRYPRQIKKLIDAQLEPDSNDIEMGVEPCNIFDFFNGKDFSLKTTLKGGYWNYEESKFASSQTPITINGAKMDANEEGRKMIMSIYENVDSISNHEFKPWDDDTRTKVSTFLSELTGNPGMAINNVVTKPQDKPTTTPTTNTSTETTTDDLSDVADQATDSGSGEVEDWLKEFDIK